MFGLGVWELLIILVIILVLFSRRLPEIGQGLGKGDQELSQVPPRAGRDRCNRQGRRGRGSQEGVMQAAKRLRPPKSPGN